jgi:hypothetical protein
LRLVPSSSSIISSGAIPAFWVYNFQIDAVEVAGLKPVVPAVYLRNSKLHHVQSWHSRIPIYRRIVR